MNMQEGHRLFRFRASRRNAGLGRSISQKLVLAAALKALNAEVELLRQDLAAAPPVRLPVRPQSE